MGPLTVLLLGAILLAIFLAVRPFIAPRQRRKKEDQDAPAASGLSRLMVRSREIRTETGQVYRYKFNEWIATAFNFVLGFISSFFGTGGGFLRTPILVAAFGFPIHIAVATSIFTLGFYTTAGAVTHAALGHVDWFPTFVFAGIGLVIGGQIGARLTNRVKGAWILRLLLVLVLVLGIRLLIQGIME